MKFQAVQAVSETVLQLEEFSKLSEPGGMQRIFQSGCDWPVSDLPGTCVPALLWPEHRLRYAQPSQL